MNLGNIYLKTFATIIATSFFLALAVASLLRYRRCSWRTVLLAALPIWLTMGFMALDVGHKRVFAAWHKWQNTVLPKQGCRTYDPGFRRLYATYSMTREDFNAWVSDHPWKLHAGNNGLLHHDGPRLGIDQPELNFETDSAPNGKQLRVYYKSGIMYVSYNAM